MPCKVKYKDRDMSYAEFATQIYNGELAALINSGIIDPSKLKGEMPESIKSMVSEAPTVAAKKSPLPKVKIKAKKDMIAGTKKQKYMTEDGKGNYVFYHYSESNLNKKNIDPKYFGKSYITSREEQSRSIPVSMYYTDSVTQEAGTGDFMHVVLIPKEKVYPFNEDPLKLYDKAKKAFQKAHPGRAFTPNEQAGWVGKMANEKGYEMLVADWGIKDRKLVRAESVIPHKAKIVAVPDRGNSIVYKDEFYATLESNKNVKIKRSSGNSGAVNSAFDSAFKQFPNINVRVDYQDFINASSDPDSVPIYDSFNNLIGYTNSGSVYLDPALFSKTSKMSALSSVWLRIAETVDPALYKAFMTELKKPENRSYIDDVEASGLHTEEKDILNQAASNMINDASYQRKSRSIIQKFADFLRNLFGIKRDFMKMTAKDFAEMIAKELEGNYPVSSITSDQLDRLDPSDARVSISGGVLDFEGGLMSKAAEKVSAVRLISPQRFNSFKSMLSYMFGGKYFGKIDNLNKQKERAINARMRELNGEVKRFAKVFKSEFKGASDTDIEKALTYINGIMSSRVKNAWMAMNARHGILSDDLVNMLLEMRSAIDMMSNEVNQFIDPQSRLSAVISGNLGFYMNRSYAVHKDGKWNKAMFPSGMKTSVFSDKRTPEMQAVYDNAFDFIKNEYPFLSSAEIDLMLKQFAKVNKDMAEDAFIESNGKVGKAYSDFLKARKDMPDQIRAFLGEYKDPMTNFYNTMANMIQFAENRKFLQSLYNTGDGKIFFDSPSSEFNEEISGTKNEYSPLFGKYTSKELADYLSGTDRMIKLSAIRKLASIWKLNQTVLSPRSVVRNFYSNFFIHVFNGHIFGTVRYMAKGFNYAVKNVSDSDNEYIVKLIEAGVLGSGVEAGVIRRVIKDAWGDMNDMTLDPEQRYNSFSERVVRTLHNFKDKSVDIYEAADNIHKIIAFESEKYDVKFMFPSMSEEEIFDMAVERFKETNIVYDKAPEVVRRLSASPLLGTFPTFTAEAMRIAVTIPMRAVKDINEGASSKNTRQALVGVKRLAGYAAGATMMNVVANLILSGFEEPEQDDDVARVLYEGAPEYAKNSSRIIINKTAKGFRMVDLDWLNPLSFIQKAYNSYENTGSFEPSDSKLIAVSSTLLESFVGPEAILSIAQDIVRNEDSSKMSDIYSVNDGFFESFKKSAAYLEKRGRPGVVTSAFDFYKAYGVDKDYEGDAYKRDLKDEALRHSLGVNIVSVDIIRNWANQVANNYAPSISSYIEDVSKMKYDLTNVVEKMNYDLKNGSITRNEYDARFDDMLNSFESSIHELNTGLVAKQLRLHKYTTSLLNVVSESTTDPEQAKKIQDEILGKYEYSIGKNVTMNQGYGVKNALKLGNIYSSDFFFFKDMSDDFLNTLGYKGSRRDMMDAYLKDLITKAEQDYE